MKQRFENLISFLRKEKKYVFVVIVLILIAMYGKQYNVANYENTDVNNIHFFNDENKLYVFENVRLDKGLDYRILLKLKYLFPKDKEELKDLNLVCYSEYAEEQKLKDIKPDLNKKSEWIEINFNLQNRCNRLSLEMPNPSKGFGIQVLDTEILRLNSLDNLKTSLIGDTNTNRVLYTSPVEGKSYKFTRKGQKIGQILELDTDRISGVDIALNFIGTGGEGNYVLLLEEAEERNGKIFLSGKTLAYYYIFNMSRAKVENLVDEKTNTYHFPLSSKITKGKKYFISISNAEVEFNRLNTLEILGGNQEGALTSIRGKVRKSSGNLGMKIYGFEPSNGLLVGEKVQDLGKKEGIYNYEFEGRNSLAYFDLFDFGKHQPFFDNVLEGISSTAKDNNFFVYKFDTHYQFNKLRVEIEAPGVEFAQPKYLVSLDNKKWQEIIKCDDLVDEREVCNRGKYELNIINVKGREFFLKASYDRDKLGNGLFGIKKIKVAAQLDMNQ